MLFTKRNFIEFIISSTKFRWKFKLNISFYYLPLVCLPLFRVKTLVTWKVVSSVMHTSFWKPPYLIFKVEKSHNLPNFFTSKDFFSVGYHFSTARCSYWLWLCFWCGIIPSLYVIWCPSCLSHMLGSLHTYARMLIADPRFRYTVSRRIHEDYFCSYWQPFKVKVKLSTTVKQATRLRKNIAPTHSRPRH
jgi:hypothetical protein